MNRFISAVCALFAVQQLSVALPASAQSTDLSLSRQTNTQTFTAGTTVTSSTPAAQNQQVAPDAVGPTLAASHAGISLNNSSNSKEGAVNSSVADPHAGSSVAMMVVGGAGFIAGLLVGGNAGAAIAIGGAAIGLYGLYEYVK